MKTHSKIFELFIIAITLTTATARAQETVSSSPYSFSGPCSSQGSWTRAALSQTSELKQIITKLKDNPACHSLKGGLEASFNAMEKNIGEIQNLDNTANNQTRRLIQLPQEISALRTFSRENSLFKNDVIQTLLGKTVTLSAMASQRIDGQSVTEVADSLSSLGRRVRTSTNTGLQLFNSTLSMMQQAQEGCLDDTQGVSLAAGMVKILSSFASSGGTGMGSQMAMAVQNLGQYLGRDKKYVNALRKLNDREFISSMSCLMEVTTDGYCSALDAQYLFQEITNSQSVKIQEFKNKKTGMIEKKVVGLNENFSKKLEQGPLAGYYILSRQVPVVTAWLQKVQYGITPQLPTEADFQIGVSTNVYQHYNSLKRIEGTFNFQAKLMGELPDFKSKQTYVLQMLNNVAGNMSNRDMQTGENFFLKVSSSNEIFFRLIGMQVPEAVLGSGPEGMQFVNNPSGWLNVKYRNLPIFNDPEKLVQLISANMQDLFKESTDMAIAYYNKYFIVDKIQVVNDSLLGLEVNVRDAFINIDKYLEALAIRLKDDGQDTSMYAGILDTRARIGRILSRYTELRDYSAELIKQSEKKSYMKDAVDPYLNKTLRKIGDNLLQEVYTELEVLTARTGFLSNRMASYVYQDYTISLRSRDQFGQYFEELMLATGYNTLNTMVNMSQTEYSKIKTDLDQSMNIYKENINSLEDIVAAGFVRNIFDLKIAAMNEDISETQRMKLVSDFARKMGSAKIPGEESNSWQRALRGFGQSVWMDLTFQDSEYLGAPGLAGKLAMPFKQFGNWMIGTNGKIVSSPVSEFDTAAGEMAKLCTQTLAFANLRTYWELCKDVQLDSPLMKKDVKDPELKKLLNTYLSVNYINKANEYIEADKKTITGKDHARNYQARICALRDYHRRNEIARMTSGMRQDGQNYESPFTGAIEGSVKTEK